MALGCSFKQDAIEALGFQGGTVVKNPPANAGDARDVGLIPGLGRYPGGGNGNSLQYSSLWAIMNNTDLNHNLQLFTQVYFHFS